MDTTVGPCQNFYQYACGNWRKENPIPSDQSRWGRFNELADRTFTHQSTVSVVVTRLVRRGLVRRNRADYDARRVELQLTAAGRLLLNRALTSAQGQLIDSLEAMPSTRLTGIGRSLQTIVSALGAGDEPASMFFEDESTNDPSETKRRRVL